jgi:hypothetical protein
MIEALAASQEHPISFFLLVKQDADEPFRSPSTWLRTNGVMVISLEFFRSCSSKHEALEAFRSFCEQPASDSHLLPLIRARGKESPSDSLLKEQFRACRLSIA